MEELQEEEEEEDGEFHTHTPTHMHTHTSTQRSPWVTWLPAGGGVLPTLKALMKRTKIGKKTEGGIVLELSPKNLTTSSKASCSEFKYHCQNPSAHHHSPVHHQRCPHGVQGHLGDSGVLLQLAQSRLVPADEVLQCGVVLHAELPPCQLHPPLELLHITQHVLQAHWRVEKAGRQEERGAGGEEGKEEEDEWGGRSRGKNDAQEQERRRSRRESGGGV